MVKFFPYLSVVVTSRNDNHGGDLLKRMKLSADSLAYLSDKFHLPIELIIVEWNPPDDTSRLKDLPIWPKSHSNFIIRVITVEPSIHDSHQNSTVLPIFQMIAKNVGIRRANGKFILATNIDILLSPELFEFISKRVLKKNLLYRIDRIDVDNSIPMDVPYEKLITYCNSNILRYNRRLYVQGKNDSVGFYSTIMDYCLPLIHRTYRRIIYKEPLFHLNAPGDFTLMSDEDWSKIRGYPELEMFSLHIDSLLIYLAHYHGIQEIILQEPNKLFHIEHALGSGSTPGTGARILQERLKQKKVTSLRYRDLIRFVEMIRCIPDYSYNNPDWGLNQHQLAEYVFNNN